MEVGWSLQSGPPANPKSLTEEPQGVFMANADDFKLPRNGQLYVSNIFERYER